jgi:L-fuconolactonase
MRNLAVIDAHCHASPFWFEPVESLLSQMERAKIEQAVLTCAVFATNSNYEEECVQRFPGKFCFVGAVPPGSPQVGDAVRRLAKRGAAGVRMRTPGVGASTAELLEVLRAATGCDTTVTLLGRSADFASKAFSDLLDQVPDARVVIEHLGSHQVAGIEDEGERRKIFELSRYPGVHLKFHGLGEFCYRKDSPFATFPFQEPIPPYLEWAYEAFGPKRLLWGSDFPNVSSREGYANALRLPREHFAHLDGRDLEDMFGGNALRLFPLSQIGQSSKSRRV